MRAPIIVASVFLCGCQLTLGAGYTKRWMDGEPDVVGTVKVSQTLAKSGRGEITSYIRHVSSIPDQSKLNSGLNDIGFEMTVDFSDL